VAPRNKRRTTFSENPFVFSKLERSLPAVLFVLTRWQKAFENLQIVIALNEQDDGECK
jgi:hypothetical protein